MKYDITFIDETLNRKFTYDNVRQLKFCSRDVIVLCEDEERDERFYTHVTPEEFTKIVIEREDEEDKEFFL